MDLRRIWWQKCESKMKYNRKLLNLSEQTGTVADFVAAATQFPSKRQILGPLGSVWVSFHSHAN